MAKCLRKLQTNDELALAIPRQFVLKSPNISYSQIYCLNQAENIHSFMISMYIRSDFPALNAILNFTKWAFEAGLFEKWNADDKMNHRGREASFVAHSLHIHSVLASLWIYIGSILLATLFFITEMYTGAKVKQRNSHRFWFFVNRLIDGQRRYWMFHR